MMQPIALGKLAETLDCRLEGGDTASRISGIAGLAAAQPGQLSIFTDGRLSSLLAACRASALLVADSFQAPANLPQVALLRTARPDLALARAIELLRPAWRPQPGIHASASVDPSAILGKDCYVGPFAVIGANCRVGNDSAIHAHVVLYPDVRVGARFTGHAHAVIREGTEIGDDVVLQPGVVIGGDGFGFSRGSGGKHLKVAQVGTVRIEDRVEIQANACIDRATLDVTRVGAGTKIDNLAQVAHNCDIGEDVLLCAQVGLAGSTTVGAGAILAGQVGVAGHCTVGKGTIITAQSGTHGDLEAGKMYSGSPAFDHAQWLRSTAAFAKLGELQRQVRELRAAVAELKKPVGNG